MMPTTTTFWLPLVPAWLWLVMAAAGVLLILCDSRTMRLVGPRDLVRRLPAAGVLALLLLLLANPVQLTAGSEARSLRLAVVVDTSASMRTGDIGGRSRAHTAAGMLAQLMPLRQRAQVQLLAVDRHVYGPLSAEELHTSVAAAAGDASMLDAAVSAWLAAADAPPHAMVLITDGHDTQVDQFDRLAAAARQRGTRVWALPLGNSDSPPRLRLELVEWPSRLEVDRQGVLVFRATRTRTAPDIVRMRVTSGGSGEGEHRLAFAGEHQTLWHLPIGPFSAAGEHPLAVDAAEHGLSLAGGPLRVYVEAVDHPLRVLWVQCQPDWDSRFVALALRNRRDIVLRRLTLLGDDHQQPRVMMGALTESQADVLVFGRGATHLLDAGLIEQLRSRVEAGTLAVLWFDAQADNAIGASGDLYPATGAPTGAAYQDVALLRPTAAGRQHPWFGGMVARFDAGVSMPAARSTGMIGSPRTTALVLAHVHNRPALIEMPLGRGRVMALEAFDLWRWRMRRPADSPHLPAVFEAFWAGMLRYLAHGSDFGGAIVSLEVDPAVMHVGQTGGVEVRVRRDLSAAPLSDSMPVTVQMPDDTSRLIVLPSSHAGEDAGAVRTYTGSFIAGEPGIYRFTVPSAPARHVVARKPDIEEFDLAARPEALAALAEATGRTVLAADANPWADVSRRLDRLAVQTGDNTVLPRLLRGWVLAAVVLLAWIGWVTRAGEHHL